MAKYIVQGGKKLKGTIKVSGSKNAALPILCAALLANEKSTIKNVPDIADIHSMIQLLEFLGCKVEFAHGTVEIDPQNLKSKTASMEGVCNMRASVLLLGPLLARFGKVKMSFPGGCILGKRPVDSHLSALEGLGAEVHDDKEMINLTAMALKGADITMKEISVTATENAVMAATLAKGKTHIRLAAAEPHVQDLCKFLNKMGAKIKGIGTHDLQIKGVKKLKGAQHTVTGDYLEAGTFAIAAAITNGKVKITGINPHDLDIVWNKFSEAGIEYKLEKSAITILPHDRLKNVRKVRTAVFPSFPTDLQAPFTVLLTMTPGESMVFETLFDGRLNYLAELEKMGAKFDILNPHQAIIHGPHKLQAAPISSWDIRAGAAMVLAALCAKGKTEISNIGFIDRGYENLEGKLKKLGAKIKRV
ncbi:UDP-N-acetylglucosamine 1-carboxyvinyltransferase [Patescibacteria group bacterium]